MSAVYRRHPQTAQRIVDGAAFIVNADNKLISLNSTATHLWTLCLAGVTVEEAARSLTEMFDVEYDEALADARTCLDALVAREVLTVDGAEAL